ncbi:MAG: CRISPR-associated endonuclease Cas1, partial [Rhabdochlamydiaceae bacterium]
IVLSKIVAAGLEPSLAFLHYNKTPIGLVFDCMEPFRRWVTEVVASMATKPSDFERLRELNYVLRCKPELRKRLVAQFGWFLEQDETYHTERWKREGLIYKFIQDFNRYLLKLFSENRQHAGLTYVPKHHTRDQGVYQGYEAIFQQRH